MPYRHIINGSFLVFVAQEKRHGGRCSRMAGGFPYCAVKNYVFPNHPDCRDMAADGSQDGDQPWQRWFARVVTPDMTSSTGETPAEEVTVADEPELPQTQREGDAQGSETNNERLPTPPPLRPTEAARAAWRRRGRAQTAGSTDDHDNGR